MNKEIILLIAQIIIAIAIIGTVLYLTVTTDFPSYILANLVGTVQTVIFYEAKKKVGEKRSKS